MGIGHDAPPGHCRTTPDHRFRIITVVTVPVPGGFPRPLALPCAVPVHKVRLRRGVLGAGAVLPPRPPARICSPPG